MMMVTWITERCVFPKLCATPWHGSLSGEVIPSCSEFSFLPSDPYQMPPLETTVVPAYHNWCHAFDVAQATLALVANESVFTKLEKLALV